MKVKDLIKALQEADPESEAVIWGYPINSATTLPGYYDGSYGILHQDGKFEETRAGHKTVLYTTEMVDLIWDGMGDLIILNPSLGKDRIASLQRYLEEQKKEYDEFDRQSTAEFVERVKKNLDKGYKIVQEIDEDIDTLRALFSETGHSKIMIFKTLNPIEKSRFFRLLLSG